MTVLKNYDVIIVGGGAAGLTAALYCARRMLKTAVISKDIGGQTNIADYIENFPGIKKIPGMELMQNFKNHAESFGAEFIDGEVLEIKKQGQAFDVLCRTSKYGAETVILAHGLVHKELNIPGEEEFKGRGVSFCATCDAPIYKNKIVAVVGGGNAALDAADLLAKIANKVYLIHRRADFRGEAVLLEAIKKSQKVEILYSSSLKEIIGDKVVRKIKVETSGVERLIEVDGVFKEIGYGAKGDFVRDLVDLNERGEVKTDELTKTSCPGIFAAGDCTDAPFKQVVVAAGEGAKAGLGAYFYLQKKRGKDVGLAVTWE